MSSVEPIEALVVFPEFPALASRLQSEFPAVRFHSYPSTEEAAEILPTVEILLVGLGLTQGDAARMASLRWVQCVISGADHIRIALAGREDVLVTNARGIHGPQVSEMALFHMLSLSRGARRLCANQDRHAWEELDQQLLRGRTLGIVGVGAIAEHLAGIGAALGMSVLGVTRTPRQIQGFDRVVDRSLLLEVAAESDYLVVLAPGEVEDEAALIGTDVFAAMKPTAFLISLGRGAAVDEAGLHEALSAGQIAGAGLDVFAEEPLPAQSPLWDLPNVMITPHLGGRNDRYLDQVMPLIVENFEHYLSGRGDHLRNVVLRPVVAEAEQGPG